MPRRVLEQGYHTNDKDRLVIITIYEDGINKETIKKMNRYSKRHRVLVQCEGRYEFK